MRTLTLVFAGGGGFSCEAGVATSADGDPQHAGAHSICGVGFVIAGAEGSAVADRRGDARHLGILLADR
jgi:hypothetical protein